MTRALIVCAAIVLVGAHVSGNMHALIGMFDIGFDMQNVLYAAAIPFVGVVALVLLRD